MFALKQWAGAWTLDLNALWARAGRRPWRMLPAVALPLIAAALGGLFELDNTGDDKDSGKPERRKRVAAVDGRAASKSRAASDEQGEEHEEGEVASGRAKR